MGWCDISVPVYGGPCDIELHQLNVRESLGAVGWRCDLKGMKGGWASGRVKRFTKLH